MNGQIIFAADILEFNFAGSDSYFLSDSGNGAVLHEFLRTDFCPDGFNLLTFLEILAFGSIIPPSAGSWTFSVSIPPLFIFQSVSGTGLASSYTAVVTLTNYREYQQGGFWVAKWTQLAISLNGGAATNYGPATISSRLAPSGLPFVGCGPVVAAAIGPSAELPAGPIVGGTSVYSASYSGNASLTAGYRFKELGSGTWISLPVTLRILATSGSGAPCEASPNYPSGSTTSNLTATSSFIQNASCVLRGNFCCDCPPPLMTGRQACWNVYDTTIFQNIAHSTITGLPDLPKSVKRFEQFYGALIFRGGMPQTLAIATDSFIQWINGNDSGNSVQNEAIYHPRQSSFLGVVTNNPSPIEDTFGFPTYAPYGVDAVQVTAKKTVLVLTQAGSCTAGGEGGGGGQPVPCFPVYDQACQDIVSSVFPALVDSFVQNPQMLPGPYTDIPECRYVDFWANPHWSFGPPFPVDKTDGALQPWEWNDGSSHWPPTQSWLKWGQQWFSNPGLPPSQNRKTRADLISDPLLATTFFGYWEGWFNPTLRPPFQFTNCWGQAHFQAVQATLPASFTMTQAQNTPWNFANGTAVFNVGSIAITPTGSPATVTAALDLGSWTHAPFQILSLIQKLVLAWSGSGFSSVAVNLVGVDAKSQTIATSPGTYDFPTGVVDVDYAGSWGRDFSAGFAGVSDTGADVPAGGISASLMASAQGAFDFQLLRGFTAASLQFVFTISNPADVITLNYPTFNLATASLTRQNISPECRQNQLLMLPNGSGIRFGSMKFFNSGSWQDPPLVRDIGTAPSALDALAFRDYVLLGVDSNALIDAEIAARYDSVEGQTRANLAADTNSHFGIAPNGKITAYLFNGLDCPPICQLPFRARDNAMQPTGPWAQEAWHHAKEPKSLICAQDQANLLDPSGNQWTSPVPAPLGWKRVDESHSVTNAESNFNIKVGGKTYAHVKPWHGWSCVLAPGGSKEPWYEATHDGELHQAYIDANDDIKYKWSSDASPDYIYDSQVTTGGGWSFPRAVRDSVSQINLVATYTNQGGGDPLASGAYIMYSGDVGQTWRPLSGGSSGTLAPTLLMANAGQVTIARDANGGILVGWIIFDAGTSGPGHLWFTYLGPGDPPPFPTAYQPTDGTNPLHSDGTGFTFIFPHDSTNLCWLAFVVNGESAISEWWSNDLSKTVATFTRS